MQEQVAQVFGFWKSLLGDERTRLDEKRRKAIVAMLRAGYSVEDLQMACMGCRCSTWHMGSNDRNRRYCSIELICRDADHVDQFCALAEAEANKEIRAIAERTEAQAPRAPMQSRTRQMLDVLLGRLKPKTAA